MTAVINGANAPTVDVVPEEELGRRVGIGTAVKPPKGWFSKLVRFYLRHRSATSQRRAAPDTRPIEERAKHAIRRACVQSALTGAGVGAAATGATVVTASTEGAAGFIAIPVAALAITSEMALRTWCHLDLICTLADLFGVKFDPDDPDDLYRLCSLAFGAHDEDVEEDGDPGKELVGELVSDEQEEISEKIGHQILGESVARSIIPFVGVGISAVTNYRLTQRLGDTTRRYMRYQRAMSDALAAAIRQCSVQLPLLIEGMWFIFIADGVLAPEETGVLAGFLKELDEATREKLLARFVEDEYDWLERLDAGVDEAVRPAFFHALEVAAAVDKHVGLPERRLLRSAARRLGLAFEPKHVERMIEEFEHTGVLSMKTHASVHPPAASK